MEVQFIWINEECIHLSIIENHVVPKRLYTYNVLFFYVGLIFEMLYVQKIEKDNIHKEKNPIKLVES